MSKTIKPKYNLPPRDYYRLDQAAEVLECSVDDLIHWGVTCRIDICTMPDLLCDISSYEPKLYCDDEVIDFCCTGEPTEEVSVFLREADHYELIGIWALGVHCLAAIELHGQLSGTAYFLMTEREIDENTGGLGPGMSVYGALKRDITKEDLFITRQELERIKSGTTRRPRQGVVHERSASLHHSAPPKSRDYYERLIAWLGKKAGAIKGPNQTTIENLSALEAGWRSLGFTFDRDRVSETLRTASEKLPAKP